MIGHVIPQMKGIKEWNYILKIFTNITLFRPLGPILAPLKKGPPKDGYNQDVNNYVRLIPQLKGVKE